MVASSLVGQDLFLLSGMLSYIGLPSYIGPSYMGLVTIRCDEIRPILLVLLSEQLMHL